ncbi:hypothetical protein [Dysgonomonas sp.]
MKRNKTYTGITVHITTGNGQIPLNEFIHSLECAIRAERQKVSKFAEFIDKQGLSKKYKQFKTATQ